MLKLKILMIPVYNSVPGLFKQNHCTPSELVVFTRQVHHVHVL